MRCRRVVVIAGGLVLLAGAAGLGYSLHRPGRARAALDTTRSHARTASSSSASAASSTTVVTTAPSSPVSSVPSSIATIVVVRPYPTTSLPTTTWPQYPWPVESLTPDRVHATLALATASVQSGVPVGATVTLTNETGEGVDVLPDVEYDLVIGPGAMSFDGCTRPELFSLTVPSPHDVLPPHATVTATCEWTPGDPGPATLHVGTEMEEIPEFGVFGGASSIAVVVQPAPGG